MGEIETETRCVILNEDGMVMRPWELLHGIRRRGCLSSSLEIVHCLLPRPHQIPGFSCQWCSCLGWTCQWQLLGEETWRGIPVPGGYSGFLILTHLWVGHCWTTNCSQKVPEPGTVFLLSNSWWICLLQCPQCPVAVVSTGWLIAMQRGMFFCSF